MEILLPSKHILLIDEEQYWRIEDSQYIAKQHRNTWYAVRRWFMPDGTRKSQTIHRDILELPPSIPLVDHIDGNGLNNLKVNLRTVTNSQNAMNRKVYNGLKYKGVKEMGPGWQARIQKYGERITIGTYSSQEEAALAYNRVAIEIFGEYARLNIIND